MNIFAYLVFSDEGPQLPAVPSALSPIVKITGFRDAPPHGGTVVLKLHITRRVKARLIHLHHLPCVLRKQTHTHLASDQLEMRHTRKCPFVCCLLTTSRSHKLLGLEFLI